MPPPRGRTRLRNRGIPGNRGKRGRNYHLRSSSSSSERSTFHDHEKRNLPEVQFREQISKSSTEEKSENDVSIRLIPSTPSPKVIHVKIYVNK